MRDAACEHGFTELVAPVRPSWKARYPLTPMERYASWNTAQGLPFDVTLVVANQTAASPELVERLKALAAEGPRRFIVVVPQSSVQGFAVKETGIA